MSLIRLPLWSSPFRPFFLLGALYGALLMLLWIPQYTGLLPPREDPLGGLPLLWHQHEILFGFSAAIVIGFILTALPSWAGTTEIKGSKLALLLLSWILGRLAVTFSAELPLPLVAVVDLSFPLLFALSVRPRPGETRLQISLGLAVISALLLVGNLSYYLGALQHDLQLTQQGLRIGLYAIIFHCSVTVGILAPIFTENALFEDGQPVDIGHIPWLEWLSALSILVLAAVDIAGVSPSVGGTLALLCCLLHGVRMGRWHSLKIRSMPIVWVLHCGYGWLVISLLLLALETYGLSIGAESWVHAFTVGGFGLMSLGLMTRVTLRHTGRELQPHPIVVGAFLCLASAAVVRVAIPIASLGHEWLLLSALLWVIPYIIYLLFYSQLLLTPSLPTE
ncbi:MAG: NnrS family protein [Halieaceae bacterium]|jgi:uncharacterized protein involved in response to NO|nr:NnrS family protein [Halieaceae bacterium]